MTVDNYRRRNSPLQKREEICSEFDLVIVYETFTRDKRLSHVVPSEGPDVLPFLKCSTVVRLDCWFVLFDEITLRLFIPAFEGTGKIGMKS